MVLEQIAFLISLFKDGSSILEDDICIYNDDSGAEIYIEGKGLLSYYYEARHIHYVEEC
jgi:hypothetical protein